ncbi:hypothetical protein [Micromonospora endophytica]|uniref:Uncharacterized protein n=1 Tax=Micromonospora endophytica TaxID=515350 RepID=A0A2W2D7N8_9ACTN|nr:hypothetical protein [Micromonospora endophytica]PZF96649.1 hypothetical protein C1I93_13675 [Micromonospora endophytica]RIW44141.1 hypothetical protein D3H59_18350 [Micromonospora endophytica]BCJ58731.1 hypothetical protein Jiend_21530 [Micromonospora endophytica]
MSRSLAGEPPAAGRRAGSTSAGPYSRTEWELLTDLPGRVIVTAIQPGPGRPHRGVTAGIAGLDAVAAGRVFDSDLVRAVVAEIYARHDDTSLPAPRTDLVDVLADCRAVVRVLERRADPADSAAYRQWVQSVAARVCVTASAVLPIGTVAPADRRLLDRLGTALGLR